MLHGADAEGKAGGGGTSQGARKKRFTKEGIAGSREEIGRGEEEEGNRESQRGRQTQKGQTTSVQVG